MKPTWRSFLFAPAANTRLVASAAARPADVVILDLEDGTHPSQRDAARAGLPAAYAQLKAAGRHAAVRINGDLLTATIDLRAAVHPGLDLLVLPKVEHARDVQLLAGAVAALEAEAGLVPGHVRLLLQIESAAAVPRLPDIAAAHPRVMGLMIGSEDFSLDCGARPSEDLLYAPSIALMLAARAAGVQAIGFIGSIADLGDEAAFEAALRRAKALGFRGAVVVHPKFIDAIHRVHAASPDELIQARRIVQAFEQADREGQGAIRVDGLMVDRPVVRRALALLAEQEREDPT